MGFYSERVTRAFIVINRWDNEERLLLNGILIDVRRQWTHALTNKTEGGRAMNCPNCMNPVEEDMREAFVEIKGWDGESYYGEEGHVDIYECHCCNCTFYVDWQGKGPALEAYAATDTK